MSADTRDICERLEEWADDETESEWVSEVPADALREAAAEIRALRAENERLKQQLQAEIEDAAGIDL